MLIGILGRLGTLQINEATKYKSLADKNRFRETKFAAPRGIIEDYFGNEIASNTRIYQLHFIPENTPDTDKLLIRLKSLINLSDRRIVQIQKKIHLTITSINSKSKKRRVNTIHIPIAAISFKTISFMTLAFMSNPVSTITLLLISLGAVE